MRTERELKDKLTEIEMKLLYHRFDDLEYLHTLQEQYFDDAFESCDCPLEGQYIVGE
jgi:hypothetical protein